MLRIAPSSRCRNLTGRLFVQGPRIDYDGVRFLDPTSQLSAALTDEQDSEEHEASRSWRGTTKRSPRKITPMLRRGSCPAVNSAERLQRFVRRRLEAERLQRLGTTDRQ